VALDSAANRSQPDPGVLPSTAEVRGLQLDGRPAWA